MTRLWLDDVRPPTADDWTWVRTADEARAVLTSERVVEASLDHDLGYDGPTPERCYQCNGTGQALYGRYIGDRHATFMETCPTCDGDGFQGGDLFYVAGGAEDNGLSLALWMVEHGLIPPLVTIHSWNPVGAEAMRDVLSRGGALKVIVAPYRLPKRVKSA